MENQEIKKELLQRFEWVFDQYLKVTDASIIYATKEELQQLA